MTTRARVLLGAPPPGFQFRTMFVRKQYNSTHQLLDDVVRELGPRLLPDVQHVFLEREFPVVRGLMRFRSLQQTTRIFQKNAVSKYFFSFWFLPERILSPLTFVFTQLSRHLSIL